MAPGLEIERRPLGDSGVSVPRIALGCGNFGGVGSVPEFFGKGLDRDQALELMDAAWEMGITHFDTADAYGGGRSEQAIGAWMQSRGLRPLLTTKTYNPMAAGADHGLVPERIERQLEQSLERLGVEQVDLYLAHEHDPEVPLGQSFAVLGRAREAGRIRAYGVSNFDTAQLEEALQAGAPAAVQNSHSLLERGDEDGVLPLCHERGIGYLAFSPLAGGWLTGKYRRGQGFPPGSRMTQRPEPYEALLTARTFDVLERLEAIGRARGTSLAGLALSWLLSDTRITQVVIGPGRPEHLQPLVEALSRPLSAEERGEIEAGLG